MKKLLWIGAVVALLLFILFNMYNSYNGLVTKQENVKTTLANVETQYQRRADLIPNLVSTVKGYATHENQTLTNVIQARATATSVSLNVDNIDQYQQSQGEISSALGRLMAVAESYPDLKANQNFMDLQAQLEGTENRIAVARRDYNNIVGEFNISVRKFPTNILASIFGFDQMERFSADESASSAPVVEF